LPSSSLVEWAILVPRAPALTQIDASLSLEPTAAADLGTCQQEARDTILSSFERVDFSRLYFGTEFCERLIPRESDVRRACDVAAARHLAFSYLTPYVTDRGLARMRPALEYLASRRDDRIEVVVNDWGTLRLLRREFPALRPVLGRLMNRMLRDPRIAGALVRGDAPEDARRALRQSGLTAGIYRRFIGSFGVTMVEFDHVVQGLEMDFRQLGVGAALYIPYGYVATGRVCMIGAVSLPTNQSFDVASPCRRECRRHTLSFVAPDSPFDRGQTFLQRGTTHFYAQDAASVMSAARMVERLGISRIVYQPTLPI
jgi:hypothetical protein